VFLLQNCGKNRFEVISMELYKEILKKILEREYINLEFPKLKRSATDMVEMQSYETSKNSRPALKMIDLKISNVLKKLFTYLRRSEVTAVTDMILDNAVCIFSYLLL